MFLTQDMIVFLALHIYLRTKYQGLVEIVHRFLPATLCLCCFGSPSLAKANIDIWVVPPISNKMILPHSNLGPPDNEPALRIVATPGEYEPASIVIRAKEKLAGVLLSASDLKGRSKTIPAANIDIKYVKAWYQAAGAPVSVRIKNRSERVLTPELLLKDPDLIHIDSTRKENFIRTKDGYSAKYRNISKNSQNSGTLIDTAEEMPIEDAKSLQPLELKALNKQQIFITVRVSTDTDAGEYSGNLKIRNNEGAVRTIPLVLSVLPFKLTQSPLLYSIYYRGQLNHRYRTVSSEFKTREQLHSELINIREHGIKSPVIYQGNNNPVSRKFIEYLRSPDLLREYLTILNDLKFSTDRLFYLGYGAGGAIRPKERAQGIMQIARKHGYNNIYFYGKDEASGKELRAQRPVWSAIREIRGKVFAANNRHDILKNGMSDLLDIAILARQLNPNEAINLRKRGVSKVLSYNNPQSSVENPYLFRTNYGIKLWASGYNGAMIYAYQHGFGSVWNDFDHVRFRDHCVTYPTLNGVIDTLAWEGFREAVDDVRYIATLEEKLKSITANTGPEAQQLRERASSLFRFIKSGTSFEPQNIRNEVIDTIADLLVLEGVTSMPKKAPVAPRKPAIDFYLP